MQFKDAHERNGKYTGVFEKTKTLFERGSLQSQDHNSLPILNKKSLNDIVEFDSNERFSRNNCSISIVTTALRVTRGSVQHQWLGLQWKQ